MYSSPSITFFLLAYNQENYIRDAVSSALAQTYSPLEIVLSDDCSNDNTFDIMSELAAQYTGPHKIVLNRNPVNLGIVRHFNKVAGEFSHGEWLVVAAGDDISLPNRTSRIAAAIQSHPHITCIGSSCIFIDQGGTVQSEYSVKTKRTKFKPSPFSVLGATAAYRRDVYHYFGPIGASVRNEDVVMGLRSKLLGDFLFLDEPLIQYRKHDKNLSGNFKSDRKQIERMRAHLGYAQLQQLADLQLFLERNPERYREVAGLHDEVAANYFISQLFSSWQLHPERRGFLLRNALASPRAWRIFAAKLMRRMKEQWRR